MIQPLYTTWLTTILRVSGRFFHNCPKSQIYSLTPPGKLWKSYLWNNPESLQQINSTFLILVLYFSCWSLQTVNPTSVRLIGSCLKVSPVHAWCSRFFLKSKIYWKGWHGVARIWRAELFLMRTNLSPCMLLQGFMFLFLDGLARTFHQAGRDCFYNCLLNLYQSYIPGNFRKEADHFDQLLL